MSEAYLSQPTDQQFREQITFNVERDAESGLVEAYWVEESGSGHITVQGQNLCDLVLGVKDAVRKHFTEGQKPKSTLLYFVHGEVYVSVR